MKTIDMTEGDLQSGILRFSGPMLLFCLTQNLYNIADRIWVGRLAGKNQLSAVGVVSPVMFLILALSVGLSTGTVVAVSQNTGAKNNDGVIKTIDTSLVISAAMSIAVVALGLIFYKNILNLMRVSENIFGYATVYMNTVIIGTPFVFLTNTAAAALRGLGDSKTPTVYMSVAALINIALDPVLITGAGFMPPMGIAGAAAATVAAQAVGFVLSCLKILKLRKNYTENKNPAGFFDKEYFKTVLKLGVPVTVQQGLLSIAMMFILNFAGAFHDDNIMAAVAAGNSFDSFAFLPALAIGAALSASAGQNTGSGNLKRIKETAKIGVIWVGALNAAITLLGYIFARQIARVFLKDVAAAEQAVIYLRIFCFFYLPFGLMSALNAVVQGLGNTLLPMLSTVLSIYIIRLPLAYFLAFKMNFGIKGVYYAMAASPAFGLAAIATYYYSGIWKGKLFTINN
jgi:putative MATE family efflux protein